MLSAKMEQPHWKYNEDKILAEVWEYLASTYNQHYTTDETNLQVVDMWEAGGAVTTTCRDNAVKYLMRYGKKDGKNRKDLLKALHYIFWMLHYDQDSKPSDETRSDDMPGDLKDFLANPSKYNFDNRVHPTGNYGRHEWNDNRPTHEIITTFDEGSVDVNSSTNS